VHTIFPDGRIKTPD